MKRVLILMLLSTVLLFTVGCDEKKVISSVRTGQATAKTLAASCYTAVALLHTSGKITDLQWERFTGIYARYSTADALLSSALKAWDAGVDKPTVERIQILLENLNGIITDLNALIDAWHIKTADIPVVCLRA